MKKSIILLLSFLLVAILFAALRDQNLITLPFPSKIENKTLLGNVVPSTTPWPTNPIHIVAPSENAHLPALSATFVCGSAPANGKLLINGTPVPIHSGGGFLTMVNLTPGKFEIKAELHVGEANYQFTRSIFVAAPEQTSPVSPLTIEYVTPRLNQELLPGDYVDVVCKGSPGMKAYFSVKGVCRTFPMFETSEAPGGIYHGVYQVVNKDRLKKSKFKVTLVNNKGIKVSMETNGTLSIFPHNLPKMAKTISPEVVLHAGPAIAPDDKAGYLMFPLTGTILQLTGRIGEEYRAGLTKTQTVWVNANQVKRLPQGTPLTHVAVGNISVSASEHSTKIRISLGQKVPFKVDPEIGEDYLDVSFFGVFSNTDEIKSPVTGAVKNLKWFQDDDETYRIRVYTIPKGWWGYDPSYEGNDFVLELRSPPPLAAGSSPLAGLTIAVDPGHSPDTGAIGATGYLEKDANLAQALNLKEKLLAKGANVVMTRKGNEAVPLIERPRIALQNKADILISMHNNSLPNGGNPFIKHGFGVYYFTPMSLPLAQAIHATYSETFSIGSEFSLRDDGLYYKNLELTRSPQMPSVLIESAYMIVPEEEAYLKTDSFRSACASAIISGIEHYARSMRPEIKLFKPKYLLKVIK